MYGPSHESQHAAPYRGPLIFYNPVRYVARKWPSFYSTVYFRDSFGTDSESDTASSSSLPYETKKDRRKQIINRLLLSLITLTVTLILIATGTAIAVGGEHRVVNKGRGGMNIGEGVGVVTRPSHKYSTVHTFNLFLTFHISLTVQQLGNLTQQCRQMYELIF